MIAEKIVVAAVGNGTWTFGLDFVVIVQRESQIVEEILVIGFGMVKKRLVIVEWESDTWGNRTWATSLFFVDDLFAFCVAQSTNGFFLQASKKTQAMTSANF